MDKYEFRRQRLISLRDDRCNGRAVEVARIIGREPSYVSRMLYPEGKNGKKRIADDMVEVIEQSFRLPKGWMDGISERSIEPLPELILTPREKIFLALFNDLPDAEADELLKTLEEKKQHYDSLYKELAKKRHGKAS